MNQQTQATTQQYGLRDRINQLGKQLVNHFFVLMKTAQIHSSENVALDQPIHNFLESLKALRIQTGADIFIAAQGDSLYVSDVKLKMDIDGFVSFIAVIEELGKRQVGEILFKTGLEAQELRKFVSALIGVTSKQTEPFDALKQELIKQGISYVEIEPAETREKEVLAELTTDTRQRARNTYLRTIGIVSEVMESVKVRQSISLRKSKRVVQSMVDILLKDETTMLGLTTIRNHDEYTYSHCVNVGILAMAIGQRLGYERRMLSELGLAAIFHDIGKSDIPLEILNKPSEFTDEEWKIMRRHPVLGVKHLVRLKGLDDLSIKIIIGGFEHHLNYDFSGYPKLIEKRDLTLFGRIISLVDCYDALTSSRVYNRIPFPPDKALKFMLSKSGKAFDPILIKIFVNCIGIYPLGSLVLLNTGEIGVIVQTNPHPDKGAQPKIKLLTDQGGNEIDGEIVDLALSDHRIARTVDAYKYGIDVARYFV